MSYTKDSPSRWILYTEYYVATYSGPFNNLPLTASTQVLYLHDAPSDVTCFVMHIAPFDAHVWLACHICIVCLIPRTLCFEFLVG
uniref:Uncharacterized protein n=1 Tax=Arundo donax TaxID=35708 RepID=A0A0A9H104_ARUDO